LIDFLENTLTDKIKNSYKWIDFKEDEELYEEIKKEAKEKNINPEDLDNPNFELKTIELAIKNIKKFWKLFREDKANIFINSIEDDFFEKLDYNIIINYINKYNEEISLYENNQKENINIAIILLEIIDFLYKQDFFDKNLKENLEKIYNKFYFNKKLNYFDYEIIFNAIELNNNPELLNQKIREKIYSWKELIEEEKDFLIKNATMDFYNPWKEYKEDYNTILAKIQKKVFGI
jgi:hypothetical protein